MSHVHAGIATQTPTLGGYGDVLAAVAGPDNPVSRSVAERAALDAQQAWPGTETDLWWKWLSEAARSSGLRAEVVECGIDESYELALRGGTFVTWIGGASPWRLVTGTSRGRFLVRDPVGSEDSRRLTGRELFGVSGDGRSRVRLVFLSRPREVRAHDAPPLDRLLALLRPERRDLWVVVVYSLVTGLLSLATPIAVESLVNTVAFGRFLQPVVILSLILLGCLAFGAAIRALQTYVAEIVQCRLFARVAADLAYRLPRVRREEWDHHFGPELVNRFFDVPTVQKVTAQLLLDGVGVVTNTAVGMALLAFYHPWLLGFDVVLLMLMLFAIFVLGRGAVKTAIAESKAKYAVAGWLQEVSRCPTAFAQAGAAEFAAQRADELTADYLRARRRHFRVLMRQIVFALSTYAVAGTALLGLGGWLVIAGQLTLGQLVAAELVVSIVVGSFAKFGKHMEGFYDLLAAIDKLGHLFDLPVERQDGLLSLPESSGGAALRVRGLGCARGTGSAGFEDLDFALAPGRSLAVLGPSGSGKSALAEVLFGLREPTRGYVELDGADPRDVRSDVLRRHVALAGPLEVLEGTVAENVQFDRPRVGSGEIRDALREAGLLETVLAFPEGLQTVLSPTGAPLSEGQVRRLVLARSLAGGPRLLVVDGVLDGLADDDLDEVAPRLLDGSTGRTTLVLTGRRDVARRCGDILRIGPDAGPIECADPIGQDEEDAENGKQDGSGRNAPQVTVLDEVGVPRATGEEGR